jgi:hypothetical protein
MYMPHVERLSKAPPIRDTLNNAPAPHTRTPRAATYNWYQSLASICVALAHDKKKGGRSPLWLALEVFKAVVYVAEW